MKLLFPFLFVASQAATPSHWQVTGRGPRPRPIQEITPNKEIIQKGGDECTIEDYNKKTVDSWITNCPSSCHIMDYISVVRRNINTQWNEIQKKMESKLEKSGKGDLHLTLEQILIRLREIFNSMMTEKEKFEEIERIYNGGNIPGILANQNIETNKLATKRTELQQKLIQLKKNFIEQTGFCKYSFKEYDEEVCDIIHHAKNVN